ncbi:MAG: histidine phosphatase family protein [Deltaproteobacteria bacterium]|nr:histidine phosphatase family protein [Deltaproteobacteria bacterium]
MSSTERPGLTHLWLVRHGESAGNVARDAAEAAGAETIDIAQAREMDVPLSPLGEQQARALARWFANQPERPSLIVASPYLRARRTAEIVADTHGATLRIDERLREKEMGSLDRLTRAGVLARFPREAELRARLGKFYYRPPGGESWCDVLFRVRAVLDHLRIVRPDERILLVAHQVVVMCARVAIEHLDEQQILAIDRSADIVNCGITSYVANARGDLELTAYNIAAPLEDAATHVTAEPPRGGAPS